MRSERSIEKYAILLEILKFLVQSNINIFWLISYKVHHIQAIGQSSKRKQVISQ